MIGNVTQLPTADATQREPDAEVVEFVEKLLQEVKGGNVRGVAFAIVYAGGETGDGWNRGSGIDEPWIDHGMMAAVHDLAFRYSYERDRGSDRRYSGPKGVDR